MTCKFPHILIYRIVLIYNLQLSEQLANEYCNIILKLWIVYTRRVLSSTWEEFIDIALCTAEKSRAVFEM